MGRLWGMGWWKAAGRGDPDGAAGAGASLVASPLEQVPEPAGSAAAGDSLRRTAGRLGEVLEESERAIGRLADDFEEMARATGSMVENAAAILGCSEGERMGPVVAGIRELGEATRGFLRQRGESMAAIAEAVAAEGRLLGRLAQLTLRQKAIVKETAVLRVLTNIEVARLGEVGAGFEYLAHELDDFARAVAESIGELTAHTEQRRAAVEATRRGLQSELPRLRAEYEEMDAGLGRALVQVDATLAELSGIPAQFHACVAEIGQQVAGVVAAIQANDITRQQTEHVQAALTGMAGEMEAGAGGLETAAGLRIQSYQLQSIRGTVEGWTGQIRSCLEGVARLAASEILELGRGVLDEERTLEAELARIERLEEQCTARDAQLEASFGGVHALMQLVGEHLERSRAVRERLQLLMFNSIVEASHLGTQADGILEISNTIKRLSAAWSEITQQSEEAMQEIRALAEGSRATIESLSGETRVRLREAQAATRAGLEFLRQAAACAESGGQQIQREAGTLEGHVGAVRTACERLEAGFAQLGQVLEEVESARRAAEAGSSERQTWNTAAMEERFGAEYTTEMERAVLRAALRGGPLPTAGAHLAGHGVELF